MDFNSFKKAIFDAAREKGLTEYELYFQSCEATSVSAYKQQINQFSSATEGGACFRCIVDGKMGYASTEDLSPEYAVGVVERAMDNAAALETQEQVFLCEGGQNYRKFAGKNCKLPTAQEMIQKALESQAQLYATDEAVVDGTTSQSVSEHSYIAICNSKGLDIKAENRLAGLIMGVVVTDGQEKANQHKIRLESLDELDLPAMAKETVERAKAKLGGAPAPTGAYPVVFSPEAMSDMLSVFSSVFSAETVQRGLSRLDGKEGQMIASSVVTVVDDPFHPDNPEPRIFDAEGSPTYTKKVIEKGELKTLLYNMRTANVAGKKTTGNGSKAGYAAAVRVSPFTMYLKGGDMTEEELLNMAENGVYINNLSGLHAGANPVTGDFSLQSAGFMIENGRKTVPVRAFTVAGNFYDLLKSVRAVADNVMLPFATGKTAFGAPSALVDGLTIAGK